jgi:hypothetical protein
MIKIISLLTLNFLYFSVLIIKLLHHAIFHYFKLSLAKASAIAELPESTGSSFLFC